MSKTTALVRKAPPVKTPEPLTLPGLITLDAEIGRGNRGVSRILLEAKPKLAMRCGCVPVCDGGCKHTKPIGEIKLTLRVLRYMTSVVQRSAPVGTDRGSLQFHVLVDIEADMADIMRHAMIEGEQ